MNQTNLFIHQGTDYYTALTLRNAAGAVFNTTGYAIVAKLKNSIISASTVPFTVTVVSASLGQITLSMDNATTAALSVHRYIFELDAVATSGGAVTRLVSGLGTVHHTVL
jgi:hypothetical protein